MKHRLTNIFLLSCVSLQPGPSRGFQATPLIYRRHYRYNHARQSQSHCSFKTRPFTRAYFRSNGNYNNDSILLSQTAKESFSVLAKRGRTWRRMKHLVALAQEAQHFTQCNSIVDIGTDHGILPIALASSGLFQNVIGVDVSEQVLRDGALTLYQEVLDRYQMNADADTDAPPPSVEFQLGNGLAEIDPGKADVVCIAGMGVNTMLKIITASELERVGCKVLLLQPTNSKPKNLMILYDTLQQQGWQLLNERIEKLSSRWYISAAFVNTQSHSMTNTSSSSSGSVHQQLPGSKLSSLDASNEMKDTFEAYIQHHFSWLDQEKKYKAGRISENEARWLNAYGDN